MRYYCHSNKSAIISDLRSIFWQSKEHIIRKQMKHWIIALTLAVFSLCCIFIGYAFHNYYTPPTERKVYIIPHYNDDTLRVAYIGDSWAAMHKEYDCILAQIIQDSIHRPVKVSSFGIHGKTSKEIYENMFDNQGLRKFMMQGYDYCFISAGINDTYKKLSTDYYKKSMNHLIRFLLTNHIHPIILDIPDYDIVKAYENQQTARQILRKTSTFITGSQTDCKQTFRNALSDLINENNKWRISILKFQEWNSDYQNDLKSYYLSDGMHLNKKGYERLDSCIALHIIHNAD